jgi:hypothetical protein
MNKFLDKTIIRLKKEDPRWKDCLFCHLITLSKNRVCENCRLIIPNHIPFNQEVRYLERIKDDTRRIIPKGK